ncbi:hypothetical protein P3S68_013931 [Capsicum galapagoense]
MKKLLWWSAWSTYEEESHDQLKYMGALSEQAVKNLVWYPAQHWCRAYFDRVCKNSACENNFTESFNKWILNARGKPIIKMLEEIRTKIMVRLKELERRGEIEKKKFSPYVMELYTDYNMIAHCCEVKFNGDQGYKVVEGEDTHVVHLCRKKCTCRTWDLTGIPCPHAIKAYIHEKQKSEDHVNWWYSKEAYMLVYMHKIQPVRVIDTNGDESEEDEQPTMQPKRISEAKTRLKAKKVPH